MNAANISPSFLLPSRVDFLSRASSCLSSLPPPPASGEAKKKVLEKGTRVESSPAWVGRRVASDCRGNFWLEPRRKGEDRGGKEGGSHAWWRSLNSFRLPPSLLLLWRCFLFECPLLLPPSFLSSQVATFRCCLRAAHTEERRGDRSSIFCGAKGGGRHKVRANRRSSSSRKSHRTTFFAIERGGDCLSSVRSLIGSD